MNVIKESETLSGVAMFAHGVGLTPMLQIVRHFLSEDNKNMPIWLLYFNTGIYKYYNIYSPIVIFYVYLFILYFRWENFFERGVGKTFSKSHTV